MNIFGKRAENIEAVPPIEEVIALHQKRIYNLLLSLTYNSDEAYDLAQETFIRAHTGLAKVRDASKIPSWLSRIAVNAFKNRIRYNRRRGLPVTISLDSLPEECSAMVEYLKSPGPEAGLADAESAARRQEILKKVIVEIHNLPPKYKIPISLYIKNHTYEEIAAVLKKRVGTVKSLVSRAKDKIKEKINKAGAEPAFPSKNGNNF